MNNIYPKGHKNVIKKLIFLVLVFFFLSFASADLISINGGGTETLIMGVDDLIEGFFFDAIYFPDVENVALVSMDATNSSTVDLNCSAFISDKDSTSLGVYVDWIKDDSSQFVYYFASQTNGTTFSTLLDSGNLTAEDVWKCSVKISDGQSNSSWIDSNELTIVGAASTVCGNGICESGETSSSCPADCSSGGGGGGGGGGTQTPTGYEFLVNQDPLIIEVTKGGLISKEITLTNDGTKDLEISVSLTGLTQYIFPEDETISLSVGESYVLNLDVYVSDSVEADVYLGELILSSTYVTEEVGIVLDVQDPFALFDISTDILKKYVNPGGTVRANVTILNMGNLEHFDVSLEYRIMDFENNNYTIKKEDFAINQTYSGIFYLEVPEEIEPGNYVFYTKVNYGDVTASSYDTFVVEKISLWVWIFVVVILCALISLIFWRLRKRKKKLIEPSKRLKRMFIRRKLKIPRLPS